MKAKLVVFSDPSEASSAVPEAVALLEAVAWSFGHELSFTEAPLDLAGVAACREAQAALVAPSAAFNSALPELQRTLGLFASARPLRAFPALAPSTGPRVRALDVMVVCQQTRPVDDAPTGTIGTDVLRVGAQLAQRRWGLLTALDAGLGVAPEAPGTATLAAEFPALTLSRESLEVPARSFAESLRRYDVVVTTPACARWMTDEGSLVAGAVGACVEASFGNGPFGLYQPCAGHSRASVSAALTAAMLLRHSLGLGREAAAVEASLTAALLAHSLRRNPAVDLFTSLRDALTGGLPYSQAI